MACSDPRRYGPRWFFGPTLCCLGALSGPAHGLSRLLPCNLAPESVRTGQVLPGSKAAEAAVEVDRLLLAARPGWRGVNEGLLEELLALGAAAAPTLVQRCLEGVQPASSPDAAAQALNRYQLDLALSAVGRLARQLAAERIALAGGLAAALQDSAASRRLLGLASSALPASQAAQLATLIGERDLPSETRRELRAACARWARADGSFFNHARTLLRSGNEGLEWSVLQGLCDAGDTRVLDELEARLMGGDTPATLLALAGEVAAGASLGQREHWSRLAADRCSSQDPALAAEACRLVARLRATWSAEALLPALDGPANVRSAAQTALSELSGLRYPAQRSLWAGFVSRERAFEIEALPALLSRVRHAPIEQLASVLRELEGHPFCREQVRLAVAERLEHNAEEPGALTAAWLN
jgi:hypothetical protein